MQVDAASLHWHYRMHGRAESQRYGSDPRCGRALRSRSALVFARRGSARPGHMAGKKAAKRIVGVMPQAKIRARAIAIAKGEYKPGPGEKQKKDL